MIKKTTLKNGLRILTIPHLDTRTVAVFVLVRTGSKYETKDKNGISHFLEHMFFKGTKKRPTALEVTEPIDRVGGIFNAFTSYDLTGYFVKLESSYIDLALDIVSDIFLNSIFPQKEIEREKGVVIDELNLYRDNPVRRAEDLWQELLYGDQPAGWPVIGTRETVSSISRQDLLSYMKRQYTSLNTLVSVAGRIKEDVVIKKVAKLFASINTQRFREKPKVKERQLKPEIILEHKDTDQTRLMLGVRGYNLFHPARFAQDILATLLGGMFSSRLFMEIREKLGISYDVRTNSESDPDTGYLVTTLGTPHQKVEPAIKTILREYKKIAEKKITSSELKKAKEHIRGTMVLALEAAEAKASFFGTQELLEQRILTPEQIYAKIKAVSAEQIRRVAQDLFVPAKLNLVVLGPFKNKTSFQNLLTI